MNKICKTCDSPNRLENTKCFWCWGTNFIHDSEHSADKPGGLSGRTTCSEAQRSEAGDKAGDLAGNSRVRRRSEAEPPNTKLTAPKDAVE